MTTIAVAPYAGPALLDGALRTRAAHPEWVVLAGGTDVMVPDPARGGVSGEPDAPRAPGVLDLFGVREMHGVDAIRSGLVRIGACTTYAELLESDLVREVLPLLWSAARGVGAVQIRERGTIGGNIVTSSPVGDMLPGLLVLDAAVVVASVRATRTVPYETFLRGYRAVDLASDELLVAIEVPRPEPGTVQHWRKVGSRSAQAVAKLSIAATARVVDGRIKGCRVAFGGVADRPLRLRAVEAVAEAGVPGAELSEAVASAVRASIVPISDVRSTAEYRADVAGRLAARFITSLADAQAG